MAKTNHVALGKAGEDCACAELTRRGYAILARRYRTRAGEIDIIARDGAALVFVEVKARRSLRYGLPAEAIDARKRARLAMMAAHYLMASGLAASTHEGLRCRFDVVAVLYAPGAAAPTIDVIQNAFEVP
jgi:putative endonuclease